jgi:LysR family transcriptional regulator, transcriptional activator for dmlA
VDRSDLQMVLAIQAHGSLAKAGDQLGLAPSAVTKRLATLEARLGQRLFQRSTRRVTPTPEGEVVCTRAHALLEGFIALEAELMERQIEPKGSIRLAATFGFGRLWLGPALAAFQAQYPLLTIELQLTETLPDLVAAGFDGAVWLWSVPPRHAGELTSRLLAQNQRVLVAAPDYIARRGHPAYPQDLAQHDSLLVRENGTANANQFDVWILQNSATKDICRVRVQGNLSSNSGELVRDWCLAGRGVMLRSLWDVASLLRSGELVQVLPNYSMVDADIHWLAPHRQQTPRRIRLLIDFLVQRFGSQPWLA